MAYARKKEATINLRVDTSQLALIDEATSLQKKDRTNFILDVVYREAVNVILDRRLFTLDEQSFSEFENILNAAPRELPKLKALLQKKPAWEKEKTKGSIKK